MARGRLISVPYITVLRDNPSHKIGLSVVSKTEHLAAGSSSPPCGSTPAAFGGLTVHGVPSLLNANLLEEGVKLALQVLPAHRKDAAEHMV